MSAVLQSGHQADGTLSDIITVKSLFDICFYLFFKDLFGHLLLEWPSRTHKKWQGNRAGRKLSIHCCKIPLRHPFHGTLWG